LGLAVAVLALAFGRAGGAAAQPAPGSGDGEITVIGYGEASAPAEAATMQMVISEEDFGPSRPPRRGAEPGEEERALVAPIVDALVAAGVAEDAVETIVNPATSEYFGPSRGLARIDVDVAEPTAEGVRELVDTAIAAAADQGVLVGQVGVGYEVADCRALEREARAAALADARERAEIQAELLGVDLRFATASVDQAPESPLDLYFGASAAAGSGCAPPTPQVPGSPTTVPPYDSTAEAVVDVYAAVAVTFAYRPGPPGA